MLEYKDVLVHKMDSGLLSMQIMIEWVVTKFPLHTIKEVDFQSDFSGYIDNLLASILIKFSHFQLS